MLFIELYSNLIFGMFYLALGFVAVCLFGHMLLTTKNNHFFGINCAWVVIGIVWIVLGSWLICDQIDSNSKPENILKILEYNKPKCMSSYENESDAPVSCLQEYSAWKIKYEKQKHYVDSLKTQAIKTINE